jgi:signal transduction histidine kinase/CheY-like chemotaxis protein
MSIRKTLIVLASTYLGISVLLIALHLLSTYRQVRESFSALATSYLDASFGMYRSELIGNLMLEDPGLMQAFMSEMVTTRHVAAEIRTRSGSVLYGAVPTADTYHKTYPLVFGSQELGEVTLYYHVPIPSPLEQRGPLTALSLQLALTLGGFAFLYALLRRRILQPIQTLGSGVESRPDEPLPVPRGASREIAHLARAFERMRSRLTETTRFEAIARTTQMLAHDVRTPFSMLTGVLQALRSTSDRETLVRLAHTYAPHVERAMRHVDAMLKDIVEAGSNEPPTVSAVKPEALVRDVLFDVLRAEPRGEIAWSFELAHTRALQVDAPKIYRVLANIVRNALQAARGPARVWVATRDVDGGRMEIAIGNTGSLIAPDDRALLFEAFFTKGKAGGTGLGLAIARKIVRAHGGDIWCESSEASGTVFKMLLPSGGPRYLPKDDLGRTTEELTASPGALAAPAVGDDGAAARRSLLIIDDQALYHGAMATLLADAPDVRLVTALTGEDGLRAAERERPDVIVVDLDLRTPGLDGFDVVARLRAAGATARICIHTNSDGAELEAQARAAGADAFLRKPMTAADLATLLAPAARPMRLVVVDDDPFACEQWQAVDAAGEVRVFASPEELDAARRADPALLAGATCVILDQFFGASSPRTGLELAAELRADGYAGEIVLSSDGEFDARELAPARVVKVPKLVAQALPIILALTAHAPRSAADSARCANTAMPDGNAWSLKSKRGSCNDG